MKILVSPEYGVIKSVSEIDAVGHRIAHGGENYKKSTIPPRMLSVTETLNPINPLHGPPIIKGMKACIKHMKDTPRSGFSTSYYLISRIIVIYTPAVMSFTPRRRYADTAFTVLTPICYRTRSWLYGQETGGFEDYHLPSRNDLRLRNLEGKAVDTSMGFTRRRSHDGTRCGSIDPQYFPISSKARICS